jgi:3-phenylpropionate/trans-cinnamate dioxygenase ferredoxin subunit
MARWVRVADVGECGEDGCLRAVGANGEPIVLARWEGEIFALEDCCSHEDFLLSEGQLEDGRVECALHGAKFDVRTGRAVQLPAVKPVRTFPVEIRGDGVFVQLE